MPNAASSDLASTEQDLDAQLARYSIDAITDMIIWLDPDGRYVFVNKAATRFLGYTAQELKQRRVCDVDPSFDEARWYAHWADLEAKGTVRLETINTTKWGEDIPIEVHATFVRFGGQQYNCSIVRNIAERKRAEAELRQLNEHVYQLSITDGLTGVANRRRFDEVLEEAFRRSVLFDEPLSVILIDVDHFKAFNDHHGHPDGDECLRRVAATIAASVRQATDLVARYGGEEFCCVLPGTGLAGAMLLAERIREAITTLSIPHAGSPLGIVTASLGIMSSHGGSVTSPSELMVKADRHLYQAKRQGRNRIASGAD